MLQRRPIKDTGGAPDGKGVSAAERRRRQLDNVAGRTLRRAHRLLAEAHSGEKVAVTAWEDEFLVEVAERIEAYGAAFRDPEKGAAGMALSFKQAGKMREIARSIKRKKTKIAAYCRK